MVLFLLALLILIVFFFGAFIMASYQEVSDSIVAAKESLAVVDTKVDGVAALVVALRAEIASGGALVTQEQLDALGTEATALKDGVAALDAKLSAIA